MDPLAPGRRIAVVGSGAAGLAAAWYLQRRHEVTLFEGAPRIGGHVHTVRVPEGPDAGTAVDMGFIVYNERNYPRFTRLLAELEVASQPGDMSFGYACERSGLQYAGTGLDGLFAQRTNLVRPGHWRLLSGILRFGRLGREALASSNGAAAGTLGEFLDRSGVDAATERHFVLPMGAAIWSGSRDDIRSFPAGHFLRFFDNHGLLGLGDRPAWRTITGGSDRWTARLLDRFGGEVRTSWPVRSLRRPGRGPIAVATEAANDQHYEVQPDFYAAVLGPWRKYSCGLWDEDGDDLESSERRMLDAYVERARIEDGQSILDLGCGWGSLSLYLAHRFPNATITSISNSAAQIDTIRKLARERGLDNLWAERHDVNELAPGADYDRVVSIEMFEHMRNWGRLLERISGWLRPGGLAFVHHFAHRRLLYRYVADDDGSWMARHFFTGGIMPSADLLERFDEQLTVVDSWDVDGTHYQRTCEAWLERMSANREQVEAALARGYGPEEARRRWHRWRVFFLACAELFGYDEGGQWIVAHRLLAGRADHAPAAD